MSTGESSRPTTDGALADAFRATFEAEFGYVCRSLRRLGVSSGDVQDIAQELFVTVHRSWADYDPSRPLRPWLFSYALRYAANYRRLKRHEMPLLRADELTDATTSQPDAGDRDIVLRALDRLDFDFRVAVVMHDLAGFSAPEIADSTGVPLNTVYSRIRLGRTELKAALERLGKGGEK